MISRLQYGVTRLVTLEVPNVDNGSLSAKIGTAQPLMV